MRCILHHCVVLEQCSHLQADVGPMHDRATARSACCGYKVERLKSFSLQEALKFARHGKRTCMRSADINHALQLRDVDQMHGFGASDRRRYASLAGASDVFYVEDTLRNCDDLIYEPLPQPPVEVGVLVHWFLVNGVKPRIPENAVSRELLERIRSQVCEPALRKHLWPSGNDCTQCTVAVLLASAMIVWHAIPCLVRLQQWTGSRENSNDRQTLLCMYRQRTAPQLQQAIRRQQCRQQCRLPPKHSRQSASYPEARSYSLEVAVRGQIGKLGGKSGHNASTAQLQR